MTRTVAKWTLVALACVLVALVSAFTVLYLHLQKGPITLGFLSDRVAAALNRSVQPLGLRVRFRDVVLERDQRNHLPTIRLRDLLLVNARGELLASAPRASMSFTAADLLRGRWQARHLELVGPRIFIWRRQDGRFAGTLEAAQSDATIANGGMNLVHLLVAAQQAARAGVSQGLESLRIVKAEIIYRDDVLGLLWRVPDGELAVRRVPYGYALLMRVRVLGVSAGWRLEMMASWRRKSGLTTISLQVQDADVVAALRTLAPSDARLRGILPASARAVAEFDATGNMLSASAEMLFAPGHLAAPDYLNVPIELRNGILQLDHDPRTGALRIRRGFFRLPDAEVKLSGHMQLPLASQARDIAFDVRLVRTPLTPSRRPSLLQTVQARGTLALAEGTLHLEDLTYRGGRGAIRLRGAIRREDKAAGIYVSGRMQNIDHRLLLALWPKKVGPGAREWLAENVQAGLIPQGTFRLKIPGKILWAAMVHDRPMPDEVADVRFSVRGVRFTHVEGWPAVADASGTGVMTGNVFRLRLKKGRARLPSGSWIAPVQGRMQVRDLAAKVSPARIEVEAKGKARAFLELVDLPPLKLATRASVPKDMLQGDAQVRVALFLPLSRHMTDDDVRITAASATVTNARIAGIVKNSVLEKGAVRIAYAANQLQAEGKGLFRGIPLTFTWRRDLQAKILRNRVTLKARLRDKDRKRLGMDLAPWIAGDIAVMAEAVYGKDGMEQADIRLDLSKVRMALPAIDWRRPPQKGTKGFFQLVFDKKGILIRKVRVTGPDGLRMQGQVRLTSEGAFRSATFSRFELNANNRLALDVEREQDRLKLLAAGPVFDARPLMKQLFAPERSVDRTLEAADVRVNISKVLALRGSYIEDVRGTVQLREGQVYLASLQGRFPSGAPITLDLQPAANGLRRLRILTNDGGALLRAAGLYARATGGKAEFTALLKGGVYGGVQRGLFKLRDFMVRGDRRLTRLERNRQTPRGPRKQGHRFQQLVLPFSTDSRFIRIGDALVKSPEIGATANGIIRRSDGAMDIGGVIIPAYALNTALGKIPVLGMILTGKPGEGVFGMTFALKGTIRKPKFFVNPLSAVAPGIFRQLFHVGGQNVNPDGTPMRPTSARKRPRSRTNLANGG